MSLSNEFRYVEIDVSQLVCKRRDANTTVHTMRQWLDVHEHDEASVRIKRYNRYEAKSYSTKWLWESRIQLVCLQYLQFVALKSFYK